MTRILAWSALCFALTSIGPVAAATLHESARPQHELYGTIRRIDGDRFIMQTRNGHLVSVDASAAWRSHQSAVLVVGNGVVVRGSEFANGSFDAQTVLRAKDSPAL